MKVETLEQRSFHLLHSSSFILPPSSLYLLRRHQRDLPRDKCDEGEHYAQDRENNRLHPQKPLSLLDFYNICQVRVMAINYDGAGFLTNVGVARGLDAVTFCLSILFFEWRELCGELRRIAFLAPHPVLK